MKQIIAIGGGGFSIEPENPSLDLYILAQTGVERPKVCFIGTGSGDAERYIKNFYVAYARYECRATHVTLFERTPDLRAILLQQNAIFVGGGNTKSMLAVWRE